MRPVSPFTALADLVEDRYVLTDRAAAYAQIIREHAAELDALLPDREAANRRLHDLVPDKHLSIRATPASGAGAARPPRRAGGLASIERRPDNLAVVAVRPTFGAPKETRPFLYAAASHVRDAGALVLDLRECDGGDTETAALIHGWLLGPDPVLLGWFEHRGRPTEDYVGDVSLGLTFDRPVAILTSARTFSGGEDLAYLQQALGRAVVVGETTGGGAHPVEHFPLPGGRLCQIPVARSVIAATGSNWEGVGVRPEIACAAGEALTYAVSALRADSRVTDPRHRWRPGRRAQARSA